jgi:hypothetical protein
MNTNPAAGRLSEYKTIDPRNTRNNAKNSVTFNSESFFASVRVFSGQPPSSWLIKSRILWITDYRSRCPKADLAICLALIVAKASRMKTSSDSLLYGLQADLVACGSRRVTRQ